MSLRCERCGGRPWPKLPELASNRVPVTESERKAFAFPLPGYPAFNDVILTEEQSWKDWAEYHRALGHELALRMREYGGPADQEEPPPGGTPVATSMRRAA